MNNPQLPFALFPLSEITHDDSTRQRKELTRIPELAESIKRLGLLQPLVISKAGVLRAGRRRLEALRSLGWTEAPVRFYEALREEEQRLVELDENFRRVDLDWKEQSLAILEIHQLLGSQSIKQTAEYIGLDESTVHRYVGAGNAIKAGDERILQCKGLSQASELLSRRRDLAIETELSKMTDVTAPVNLPQSPTVVDVPGVGTVLVDRPVEQPQDNPFKIIQGNFLEWAKTYQGPKFNFIHCDFPYGIGFDKSDAAGSAVHDSQYEDSEDTYWKLLTELCMNQDRLLYSSAHMMFWLSAKVHVVEETVGFLEDAGWFVHDMPMIWHKSCGSGIASDYRRRPKHVYETCLFASRGDRQISKLVNDLYSCPIAKDQEGHLSAKPEPMLRHFMSMAVNDLSEVLDPTCGSGTSLRAAASLGATRVLGLEINADLAASANRKLQNALKLSKLSEAVA